MSSEEYKKAFIVNHARLVRKLKSFELLQATFTKGLITQDEKDRIEAIQTDIDRLNKLLGIFHRRYYADKDIFKKIFEILEEINADESGYIDHLIRGLNEFLEDPPTSLESHDPLNEEDRALLCLNEAMILEVLDVTIILPDLISEGVVSPEENETIENIDNFEGRAQKFLSILTSRSSESFQKFLNILINTEVYKQLAYKLKGNKGSWDPNIGNDQYDHSQIMAGRISADRATKQPNEGRENVKAPTEESTPQCWFNYVPSLPNKDMAEFEEKLKEKSEQQSHSAQAEMADNKDTKELQVFDAKREDLSDLLIHSLDSLASHCFQVKLVLDDVTEQATEELAQTKTDAQKTQKLLRLVMKRLDNKMEDAATVWKHFMSSIEDMEAVHKYLSNQPKDSPSDILRENFTQIMSTLQYNLIKVAGMLMQTRVINSTEHWLITNPNADHKKAAMLILLDAIRTQIKQDKNKMYVFLDVVEKLGGPAEKSAEHIRKELKPSPPPSPHLILPDDDKDDHL